VTSAESPDVGYRPMVLADLPVLAHWLDQEHVRRWWRPEEYETVDEHYRPSLEGREPTDHYLILLAGTPIGMIQTYLVSDHPEWEALVQVGPGVAGVDILIGELERIGQGIGPATLRGFARDVVFRPPATIACIAGVEVENGRSLRAFEKAGFRPVRDYLEEGRPHRLVRLDRAP
jgi:aminoglycoside 6'-N-acetyltransferase